MRIVTVIRLSLVTLCIAFCAAQSMAQSKVEANGISSGFSKGFGCLLSQSWVQDDLRELGIKPNERARVVYGAGTIPGLSPASSSTTNVLVLTPGASRGWLFFFRVEADGSVVAVRNGYRISHTAKGWSAGEGNGWIATYKAVATYAAELARGPFKKTRLKPSSEGCHVE